MGTEVEQRRDVNAPPELTPLAKLGRQIRLTKYKPTVKETEVLQKCVDDGNWYNINGAVLSAAVVWNLTGKGRKLNLFPRLVVTAVAGLAGRQVSNLFAGRSCMRRILSLEGSPLRGELIAILQKDFPNHPLLKTIHQQPEGLLHTKLGDELAEYGPDTHTPLSTKDMEMDDSNSWDHGLGRETGYGQTRNVRLPRIWETANETQDVNKDFNGADILADPFDLLLQTGPLEDTDQSDSEEQVHIERRRSRMTVKDRREYDKKNYEHRHEQRSY